MIKLRPIDPAKNMRRFYRLDTQPDLFGGVFLMKEWGRIGAPGHHAGARAIPRTSPRVCRHNQPAENGEAGGGPVRIAFVSTGCYGKCHGAAKCRRPFG